VKEEIGIASIHISSLSGAVRGMVIEVKMIYDLSQN
jgi:hypothetical protein